MPKTWMDWSSPAMKEQHDANGDLTPLALAINALEDYGCDCGADESGTCIACLCEAALQLQWESQRKSEEAFREADKARNYFADERDRYRLMFEQSEAALRVAREIIETLAAIADDADIEPWSYWDGGGTPPDSTPGGIRLGHCRKARQALAKINSILNSGEFGYGKDDDD